HRFAPRVGGGLWLRIVGPGARAAGARRGVGDHPVGALDHALERVQAFGEGAWALGAHRGPPRSSARALRWCGDSSLAAPARRHASAWRAAWARSRRSSRSVSMRRMAARWPAV